MIIRNENGDILEVPAEIATMSNLRGANLRGLELTGAQLAGMDCEQAQFEDADLSLADLRGTNLRGASFIDAVLYRTDMRRTTLAGADFTRADLVKADLRGVDLTEARWHEADTRDANLTGARIRWYDTPLVLGVLYQAGLAPANPITALELEEAYTKREMIIEVLQTVRTHGPQGVLDLYQSADAAGAWVHEALEPYAEHGHNLALLTRHVDLQWAITALQTAIDNKVQITSQRTVPLDATQLRHENIRIIASAFSRVKGKG